jgi:hypothetical protein
VMIVPSTSVLRNRARPQGLPIGLALLIGTLEFMGPNEKDGWSLWLVALGVFLLL